MVAATAASTPYATHVVPVAVAPKNESPTYIGDEDGSNGKGLGRYTHARTKSPNKPEGTMSQEAENYQKAFVISASMTIAAYFLLAIFDDNKNGPIWDLPIHLLVVVGIARVVSIIGSLATLVTGGLWWIQRRR